MVAGQYHLCALVGAQEVDCWGGLSSEQAYTSSSPQVVKLDAPIVELAAGGGHTCALTVQGRVQCWGDNYFGQLGDASDLPSGSPVVVQGLDGEALRIASGSGHVCALFAGGAVKCWGDGSFGQLGDLTILWRQESYTSPQYGFTLDYPAGWKLLETPTQVYATQNDQIWLSGDGFPPPQTGARTDVALSILQSDPAPGPHTCSVKISLPPATLSQRLATAACSTGARSFNASHTRRVAAERS